MSNFDILADSFYDDPYPVLAQMRKESPCYFDSRLEAYVLTRYHDVERVLKDTAAFSAQRVSQWGKGMPEHLEEKFAKCKSEFETWIPFTDPPLHTCLRARLVGSIGSHLIPLVKTSADKVVSELVADLKPGTETDLVTALATPAATKVLADILGISQAEIEQVKQWTSEIFSLIGAGIATEEAIDAGYSACNNFREFTTGLMERRRDKPGDDVLSALIASCKDPAGADVSAHDLTGLAIVLFAAGHESTTNLIGNGIQAILLDPEARAHVLEKGGISEENVDELTRFQSPFLSIFRKCVKESTLSGEIVGEGGFVLCMVNSANRDVRFFKNKPDKLNLAGGKPAHLGFGTGIHACAGLHIARIVVQQAVSQFFRRFPQASTDASRCLWHRNLSIRGMSSFPVQLEG